MAGQIFVDRKMIYIQNFFDIDFFRALVLHQTDMVVFIEHGDRLVIGKGKAF